MFTLIRPTRADALAQRPDGHSRRPAQPLVTPETVAWAVALMRRYAASTPGDTLTQEPTP